MKNILKFFFFKGHIIGIYFIRFGWIIFPKILLVHPFIFLSWYLNNNKCLITQIEYKLFGSTFLGNEEKFKVPVFDRYILYFSFLIGSLLNFMKY